MLGDRAEALAQVAADEGADVIVVGSRPAGLGSRKLRCSLARELEAATPVPVLVAPPTTRERSGHRLALAAEREYALEHRRIATDALLTATAAVAGLRDQRGAARRRDAAARAAPGPIHASIALVEGLDLVVGARGDARREPPPAAAHARADRSARRADADGRSAAARASAFAERGGVEVVELVRAFNQMLDRLETERRESGRRALAAQEAERLRIARGLHDEVGQVLTGVLLQLDALAAPDEEPARTTSRRRSRRCARRSRRCAGSRRSCGRRCSSTSGSSAR